MSRLQRVAGTALVTGVLLTSASALYGQESNIPWEPSGENDFTLTWRTIVIGCLIALAFYGVWRLFIWFLETKRAAINWRRLRIWWPTVMLAWGCVLYALPAGSASSWPFTTALVIFSIVNAPAVLFCAISFKLLDQWVVTSPTWLRLLVFVWTIWIGNHVIVRLAAWRAWRDAPISLNLKNGAALK